MVGAVSGPGVAPVQPPSVQVVPGSGGAGQGAGRRRVASLNLCTDQLVLMLADRADIVGLSALARDCTLSVLCERARAVPVLPTTAESVLAARPGVVLAGDFTARLAVSAARQVGANVTTLPPASSLADVGRQIMLVARAVGHPERGQALAAAFAARLAELARAPTPSDPVAVIYEANGLVVHRGSLLDDVLMRAGLRNFATVMALPSASGRVPLEVLLNHRPELLVRNPSGPGYSLAQGMLENPVLLAAFPPPHVVDVPQKLWLCALPQTLDALAILRHARDALTASAQPPIASLTAPPIAPPIAPPTAPTREITAP
ncbi:ABC transporter substrate-binding protein [Acetobacter sp. TBRC 12305]|uniref:ABC transporter substrate-binding protein n=2 Tax=Acetobacter garciniae TaxID=2817435 RepID=A0A939KP77_9PROT|nr:ABC transporter substrate-binding protein [Acetobacter garciniae]MBO1323562.1 ABC transporter substrate-binding protein [Acetobacter garciniae]MBX0343251.1 ABC transporter substrate-binding protein [Acetobacter garciniae]